MLRGYDRFSREQVCLVFEVLLWLPAVRMRTAPVLSRHMQGIEPATAAPWPRLINAVWPDQHVS